MWYLVRYHDLKCWVCVWIHGSGHDRAASCTHTLQRVMFSGVQKKNAPFTQRWACCCVCLPPSPQQQHVGRFRFIRDRVLVYCTAVVDGAIFNLSVTEGKLFRDVWVHRCISRLLCTHTCRFINEASVPVTSGLKWLLTKGSVRCFSIPAVDWV